MMRMRALLFLLLAFTGSGLTRAHEGHPHLVLGTLHAVRADRLEVEDAAGAIHAFQITPGTKFLVADVEVPPSQLRVGERVAVEAQEKAGRLLAVRVRMGKAPAASGAPK